MSDYHQNIVKLRKYCKRIKYQNELDGNEKLTEKSKEYFQMILKEINDPPKKETSSTSGIFDEIDSLIYKRYWHKLKSFHQKVKLREYVENLKISKESRKEKLIKDLYDAVDLKILTKKGSVEYDPFSYCIKSIVGFEYDDKKKKYSFIIKK